MADASKYIVFAHYFDWPPMVLIYCKQATKNLTKNFQKFSKISQNQNTLSCSFEFHRVIYSERSWRRLDGICVISRRLCVSHSTLANIYIWYTCSARFMLFLSIEFLLCGHCSTVRWPAQPRMNSKDVEKLEKLIYVHMMTNSIREKAEIDAL